MYLTFHRVGSWPNGELVEHFTNNRHAIVSNEWDFFDPEKLKLSSRSINGVPTENNSHRGPQLLFLTTLREPNDRLLSAYVFFALTTTENRRKANNSNGPTFNQWINNNAHRMGNFKAGSKSAFRANTARFNHIVWRFSGGKLTKLRALEDGGWKKAFETSVRALSQFDLILPMEDMTKDGRGKTALERLIGWDRFDIKARGTRGDKEGGHVVTQGGIRNSNARAYFDKDEYSALWKDNWLDNLLYMWCRAVFLARLHCNVIA